jgi:hypothetical protein
MTTNRFTQSNTRYMEYRQQGGSWVEVEIPPPPGPTPELSIPAVLDGIKVHLRTTYHLIDSDGRCEPDGEVPCRCDRAERYEPRARWTISGGFTSHIPPVGGMRFWICRIDFEATVTKYRARGECVPAAFPGRLIEGPEDTD